MRMKDGKEREGTEKTKEKEATHEKSSKAKRKTTAGPSEPEKEKVRGYRWSKRVAEEVERRKEGRTKPDTEKKESASTSEAEQEDAKKKPMKLTIEALFGKI